MTPELKRDIRKTGIFMLIPAFISLLVFPMMLLMASLPNPASANWLLLPYLWYFAYAAACFVVLVRGVKVIWELPIEIVWRIMLFFVWLILYPALCLGWLYLIAVVLFFGFHSLR
ncbi:MAG: hypothetical protein J5806_12920 [Lentisphaeria bacterium]|nr:hypothetical protein [Lentisphaeria bacterium]